MPSTQQTSEQIFRQPLWLHRLALIEGWSLIGLVNLAMPLKYLAGQPLMVKIWGMAHGLLFLAYGAALLMVALRRRWPLSSLLLAGIVSVVPFGFCLTEDYLPAEPVN